MNYINLDMAGVNWPGGGGAPHGDPDPEIDEDGYPKDSEVWPLRVYIGPGPNHDQIDQPGQSIDDMAKLFACQRVLFEAFIITNDQCTVSDGHVNQAGSHLRFIKHITDFLAAGDLIERWLRDVDLPLTDQFRSIIVSVNGHTSKDALESFIENMPALDSKYLRGMYARITPNVDMTQVVTCSNCSSESEVQIPFTVDFFWPKS